jgi:hypothetical protein
MLWKSSDPAVVTYLPAIKSQPFQEKVMIERNLGNVERVTRLVLGIAFAVWAMLQPAMNGIEWFVVVISLALMLNGIFSRCYVWYLLDINTTAVKKSHDAPATTAC